MKKLVIFLIKIYQKTISPDHGFLKKVGLVNKPVCVFYPTCSEYAVGSIDKHGLLKGGYYSFTRILRCHPWQKNHIDPIR